MTATIRRMIPVVESSNESDMPALNWIYAHGELEDRMGWDCLCGAISLTPGIHPVIFRDSEGELSALAICWQDTEIPRICGLVVAKDDLEAIQHATRKMLAGAGC